MLKKVQPTVDAYEAINLSKAKIKENGSQPDDLVTSFRREGAVIILGSVDRSGTKFPERAYAVLKSMTELKHPRARSVTDLSTIMAFARLPDGEKLDVSVRTKGSDTTRTETVGIRGFWELIDEASVTKISLTEPKGIIFNLSDAKVTEVISSCDSEGVHCIESAITIEGYQRYVIKSIIPPLNMGVSASYMIQEIRSGINFKNTLDERKYERLDLMRCPGRHNFQSQTRDLYFENLRIKEASPTHGRDE